MINELLAGERRNCVSRTSATLRHPFLRGLIIGTLRHTMHVQEVEKHTKLQAEDSMYWEREEVRGVYGAEGDDVVNVLVSCDGAWQKLGFLLFLELYSSSSLRPAR